MYAQKTVITCENKKDSELASYAFRIADALKDNSYFPNPEPSVKELRRITSEYADALMDALLNGNRVSIGVKNEKRQALCTCLHKLEEWVNVKAKCDRAILECSGFDLTEEYSAIEEPGVPDRQGHPEGEITYDI